MAIMHGHVYLYMLANKPVVNNPKLDDDFVTLTIPNTMPHSTFISSCRHDVRVVMLSSCDVTATL